MKFFKLLSFVVGLVVVTAKSISVKESAEDSKGEFPHSKDYYDGYIRAIVDNYDELFNSGRKARSTNEQEANVQDNQQANNTENKETNSPISASGKQNAQASLAAKHAENKEGAQKPESDNQDAQENQSEAPGKDQESENQPQDVPVSKLKDNQKQPSDPPLDPYKSVESGKPDDSKSDTKESESATPDSTAGETDDNNNNNNKDNSEDKNNKELTNVNLQEHEEKVKTFAAEIKDDDGEEESGSGEAEQAVQRNLIEAFTKNTKKEDLVESLDDIKHFEGNGDDFEDMKKRDAENDNINDTKGDNNSTVDAKQESKAELSKQEDQDEETKDNRDYESTSKVVSHSSSTYTPGDPNKMPSNSNQQTQQTQAPSSTNPQLNSKDEKSKSTEKHESSKVSKKSTHSKNVKMLKEAYEQGEYRPSMVQPYYNRENAMLVSPVVYGTMTPMYMYYLPIYGVNTYNPSGHESTPSDYAAYKSNVLRGSKKSLTSKKATKKDKEEKDKDDEDDDDDDDKDDHEHVYLMPLEHHPGWFEYGHGMPTYFGDEYVHEHHLGHEHPIIEHHGDDYHHGCTCSEHHEQIALPYTHGYHFPGHFHGGWPWYH